jgi:uncharacterized protein (DUF885 family)
VCLNTSFTFSYIPKLINQINIFFSQSDALEYFRNTISKINSKLPMLFGPEILKEEIFNVEVKPVPANMNNLAYYMAPSLDGKRKGAFYVNLHNVNLLKKFETMSLTLHETNPGYCFIKC